MASSNKHWPSMFKSKPSNTAHHHQWQHDLSACNRNPYSPGPGCEERTPEPKPRWNPRPEQIRILESIFNSGMVNPPRDEIRKIRAQLQEYGQVGDANVFYWFQNRKSRSKHKQRQLLHHNKSQIAPPPPPPIATTISATATTPPSSSSSSSDKSSPNNHLSSSNVIDLLNSPTGSVNQPYFQTSGEFLTEPYFFPVLQGCNHGGSGGFCFPENVTSCVGDQTVGNCPSVLLGELMLMSDGPAKKNEDEKMKMQQQIGYGVTGAPNSGDHLVPPSLSPNHMLQGAGLGESGPPKSTVFINDVCFEVAPGPFNVRDAFGDDAMLIQSSGQPVVTNEWGVTLLPLQHGAFYYLVRAFSPSQNERTIDLI